MGVSKGDIRSLDYGSHVPINLQYPFHVPCSFPFESPLWGIMGVIYP